ncbi:uncharacterized protein [Pyxicephalus adspersus]|uniref:uncharacterized protein isoform X2 n=1 Tax=Pyxicephalus adspersus TaxID=30357 RepID=UPI003B5A727F
MDPVEDDENYHGQYQGIATENDVTQSIMMDYPRSLHTLGPMELSCSPDFQFSYSQWDFQWSQEVLEAIGKLPDFTPNQNADLNSVVNFFFQDSKPVSVKDYLEVFHKVPENLKKLRNLTKLLKSLGREDVVKAMHLQNKAIRWLGPVLQEEMLISDIAPSLWVQLTTALSTPHQQGEERSYHWAAV